MSLTLALALTFPLIGRQESKQEIDIEAFIEDLFSFQEEDISYEDLYETLLQLHLNPINLHVANAEELKSLYTLNPLQITEFLQYREKYGPFESLHELQAIPEWDLNTIHKVLPFVSLPVHQQAFNKKLVQRITNEKDAYLLFRHRRVLEPRKGFTPPDTLSNGNLSSRYLGDPNDIYARFRIQHARDFSLGFTVDKDPGEVFTWDPKTNRYGFNFLSYHLTLYDKNRWKTLTVGDYQVQYGQGIVFGAGFSVGKGAETISTVRRSSLGIRPYTSVLESGFFRGAAATYQWRGLEITGLYSNAPRDANIQVQQDSLDRADEFFSSLLRSGLHRTAHEIGNKAQARELNIGGNIHYNNKIKQFQLGINSLYTKFSQPLIPQERIYNGFEFRGRENHIHSVYYSYNYQNHFFFGEAAVSASGGSGAVIGLMSSLNRLFDFSFLWRTFDRDFHSFYGNAFSENSRPINEEGVYLGLNFKPSRKLSWSAYYDHFKFPWMRFRAYAPSTGHEWLTRFNYKPDRNLNLFIQLREEIKSRNISSSEQTQPQYHLAPGRRRNYVMNLDYKFTAAWQFKSRVQFSQYRLNGHSSKGYAIVQDLNGSKGSWKAGGRIAFFDTDDFENRQYVYEKNVLWTFSIPSYYGQGMRYYFLAQWKASPQITLWGRWARTLYTDRSIIGSGLQEIMGNKQTETTLQVRYQFNR
ncbi:helix-hairpin-helix domain-containing protein [Negadavirga shengliensis]|uniref:Helix-hairpin-helix domain-containing protein n=1 Tax=Negadavirga shengliensis TaxID=1389218 RepID=A0ABV9SYN8_9BACT